MKLSEHVDKIRELIYKSFNNQFASLGIAANKESELNTVAPDLLVKRNKIDELIANHTGETGKYEEAREKALDELTFTLFNRIAALKVMEALELFPPIVTKTVENGDRSFGHKIWLEANPNMREKELEGIREYFKFEFNKLGEAIPLFHKNYPYALLPYVIDLNEIIDAFNAIETDTSVERDVWQSDDILGWLYESYNNYKKLKHKESKAKTEYDKVSIQSQVYTPRWVVEFLVHNSLGKMYLEMYPDSEIASLYKIANAPKTRVRELKPLHELKLIDPASGSGNFLLYAFVFFYALYKDQIDNYGAEYEEADIPRLIIENNLHGIDLDDRAIQLAQLGLWIKAKQKNRKITSLNFNVVSSDFFLPDFDFVLPIFKSGVTDSKQLNIVEEIWTDLQQAHKFGSLVKIEEKLNLKLDGLIQQNTATLFDEQTQVEYERFKKDFFENLEEAITRFAQGQGSSFLTDKTKDAITFLKLITQKYDVATANPPYTDSSDFGPDLKKFIEANYKKPYAFHTNLYATFIKRCFELIVKDGYVAMLSPLTFMYIKTFEDVRKFILSKSNINILVELGLGGVFANNNVQVDVVMYVLKYSSDIENSVFLDFKNYKNQTKKPEIFSQSYSNYLKEIEDRHVFILNQAQFKAIKSYPFIYWISEEFRKKFKGASLFHNCQGLATADNNRFLRFWWELASCEQDIISEDWVTYAKGGPFKKWSGNLWLKLKWTNNGSEIRNFNDENGNQRSRPQNENYYFTEGITYSASGSKGPSFRYLPNSCIFDVGGSSIFPKNDFQNNYYILAFFNSKFTTYILNCLNPTVNSQVGDIQRIPLIITEQKLEQEISMLSRECIEISNRLNSYNIFDFSYVNSFQNVTKDDWKNIISNLFTNDNHLITKIVLNEAFINEKFFEVYQLTPSDKAMVLENEGESIGSLPVISIAKKAYLENEITAFPLDNIKEFIESLPEKEFTADEHEAIVSEFPSLYQSNNDLEEFCIRHQVNPINVWYWFKESNVTPKQRMNTLAMEFLADIIREILLEDEDGIIPLVPNAGEKILIDRIEEKFIEKGFTMAQFSAFESVLGTELNDYINNHFFSIFAFHLKLFKRLPATPFIWHLTSGPEQGFDCYIIIYKWSKDKLMRVRSVYIENRERALINRQSDLANDSSASAQNEKETIFKQLKEIEIFKKKIDELLSEGYNPILDDGVGKNIAPLQKKKMLAYEVLNAGQLKTYLNADW